MKIYRSAVNRPITTLMVFIAMIGIGLYSLRSLPVDLYPDIEPPIISVFTTYPGANAADIETNVTRPIENNLSTIGDLKEISSVSRDNISTIILEFEYGTNLDEATNEIRDVLGRIIRMLPEDVEQPIIFKFSSAMIPVMVMSVTADESYPALAKILDQYVVNPLNRIDGVGTVVVMGEVIREVQVNVDPYKLEAFNITVEQIGGVLASENLNMPAGNIKTGQVDYPLRFTGEFEQSRHINDIVVGYFDGVPIHISDVAEVNDTLREMTIEERIGQRKGMRMVVQRQSGANSVQIANQINARLDDIRASLPTDVELDVIINLSDFITDSINNLVSILYYAAIFVTIVVLVFLGRWRATFIIILTIPVSLIAAFIYLYISGNSLNIISLSSLTIAMGMVVDDAIVVLENITRHSERGSTPRESAIYGTNEVGLAVVASTLTVVAVFFPLTLISGLMGLFFQQLGYIVSITVVVSTVAALTLTPMLSSKLMNMSGKTKRSGLGPKASQAIDNALESVDNAYARLLTWAVGRKAMVVVISVGLFIGSFFLMPFIGTSFMPDADQNVMNANIELPVGTRLEETSKVARAIEDIIVDKFPEADMFYTSAGYSTTSGFFGATAGSHTIEILMRLVPRAERDRDVWQIAEAFRLELETFPEIVEYVIGTEGGGMGMGAPIEVEIYGEDFDQTNVIASELAERMEEIEGVRDVNISRGAERPELRIVPDRDKMASFGLSAHTVSNAVRNRVEGMTATRYREDGDEYNVVIRHKEEFRNSIADIENISLRTPSGQMVRLGEIAKIEEYFSPPNIERKNRIRYLSVTSSLHGRSLGDVTADIQAALNDMDLPEGIDYAFGGQIQDQQEAFSDLIILLFLSIFLVYVVMAAQFESFRMPFIIMLAVPFAFTGVMIALFITGTELSVISMIGGIILVGIVVKNSIVLIDFTNLMVARGLSIVQSVITAGKSRLRPVLMTTLTTLLAMIPMALSTGEGSEIWAPMAIAVIGGLSFSTLITLVFVPVVYAMFGAGKVKKERKRIKKNGNGNH